MRTARALPVSLVSLLLAVFVLSGARAGEPRDVNVVVISIDALRPEFYLSDAFDTPTLKALAAKGARAKGVEAAYPSVTYAGHASIVTGMRPNRHGVMGNTIFDEAKGPQPEWVWEAKALTAKPLWQAAKEHGRKVAILMWPTTVGAKVDWLVPELWSVRGESTRELLLKNSTPGLLLEVALALGVASVDSQSLKDPPKIDEFVSGAAAYVLEKRKPNLLFVHLIQVDSAAHANGRDADAVKAAVARTDANVAKLIQATKTAGTADKTVFVIVGDHGFTDYKTSVAPNTLLANAGLVELDDAKKEVKSWRALGHSHGGSMAVFAKDEVAARAAHAALEQGAVVNGETLYRIIERAELDALGANPKAAFWLEAGDDKGFSGALTGDLTSVHAVRGTHGGLPTRTLLHTGFIASGPGVRPAVIDRMRLVDVAPTLAKLMGVELPETDGAVLDVLDDEPY